MPDTVEISLAVVTYLAYLQSQYDTFCLDFSLEYLTSVVYISHIEKSALTDDGGPLLLQ